MQYLYLIQSNQYHKIGIANDVRSRLAQLQTGNPVKLQLVTCWGFEDAISVERALHQKYASYRVNGEWFEYEFIYSEFDRLCEALGGVFLNIAGESDPEDTEEAEEVQGATNTDGAKFDYVAMFADGWRIEPSSSRGKNGVYWAWRKQVNGKRPYIYGGLISELPYPIHEMKRIYQPRDS